jgi:membrane-associated phospholipid phosphatase
VLYPLCLGAVFMVGGRLAFRETATAVGLALAVSLASYMLIPVKGPVLSRAFDVPLDFWIVGPIKEAMMDKTRITYDCFPSFHTAGAVLLSWGCWRHARKVFWWTIAPSASIPFACVYLRYHYVVDVLAGLAMSALLMWSVPRLLRWWQPSPARERVAAE